MVFPFEPVIPINLIDLFLISLANKSKSLKNNVPDCLIFLNIGFLGSTPGLIATPSTPSKISLVNRPL